MGSTDSLADLARPALATAGLDLWDVEVTSKLVRFLVDRPGGVDLDAVATAGAVLTPLLEDHDDLVPAGRYDLEVSSPGIERTLRTPEHFRRSPGALLSVKTRTPVDGSRRLRGTLSGSDDEGIDLVLDGSAEAIRLELADIDRAKIVFEWGSAAAAPPPKRGKRATSPSKQKSPRQVATAGRTTGAPDQMTSVDETDAQKGSGS